jgi:hypothetical protein
MSIGSLPAEPRPVSLFDGKSLDGWIQSENNTYSFGSGAIQNPTAFAAKLSAAADAVSAYVAAQLQPSVRDALAAFPAKPDEARPLLSALTKDLNQLVAGPSIYEQKRFASVVLRPETTRMLAADLRGAQVARLNKALLEDAFPSELVRSLATGWTVKDGAMASTGSGRGVIYTEHDYSRFRLAFTMRHVSGNPDHQACVLIFCTRPQPGERPLDALAGIQFQVPNGGHWDYRPGKNNDGGRAFNRLTAVRFDPHQWCRAEIVADASTGTARMKVAQPPGATPVDMLEFNDPAAGKPGPFGWQMHNAGLFDEFKDVEIEIDSPK